MAVWLFETMPIMTDSEVLFFKNYSWHCLNFSFLVKCNFHASLNQVMKQGKIGGFGSIVSVARVWILY